MGPVVHNKYASISVNPDSHVNHRRLASNVQLFVLIRVLVHSKSAQFRPSNQPHNQPDDQKAVISYDPRERKLLPRVRFNANTGHVLQSVAEEDELVLSTFNRCLTSLSDSDETENELFV